MEARAEGPFSDATSSSEWGGKEEQHIALCPEVFSNVTFSYCFPSFACSVLLLCNAPAPPPNVFFHPCLLYYCKGQKPVRDISPSFIFLLWCLHVSLFSWIQTKPRAHNNQKKTVSLAFFLCFMFFPLLVFFLQASRPLFSLQQGHVKHTRTHF